jgi:hypothetical protein
VTVLAVLLPTKITVSNKPPLKQLLFACGIPDADKYQCKSNGIFIILPVGSTNAFIIFSNIASCELWWPSGPADEAMGDQDDSAKFASGYRVDKISKRASLESSISIKQIPLGLVAIKTKLDPHGWIV